MRVVLIRKLADYVDGVDLSQSEPGETLRLSERDGSLLVAEGWARLAGCDRLASVGDASRQQVLAQIAGSAEGFRDATDVPSRRAEDYIREELHEKRARIVSSEADEPAPWECR